METVRELLAKLDNKVTPTMAKKLDGMQALQAKLEVARQEYEAEPNDEKSAYLKEIEEFMADENEDIIEDLKVLVRRKKFAEEEAKSAQNTPKDGETPKGEEKEEKTKFGVLGVAIGVFLFLGSAGLYNHFRNNR